MYSKEETRDIYNKLEALFPEARCELNYNNLFELLISVVLSAQTTDKRVNEVTSILYKKYKNAFMLAKASFDDVFNIIKPLGLAYNKTNNIIKLSKALVERFDGNVPSDPDDLVSLPGVGLKTMSVMLCEGFKVNAVPVDTHVYRVAHRLGISSKPKTVGVARDIFESFDEELLNRLHILLIFFGRYKCKAMKPLCDDCPFKDTICRKQKGEI